MGRMFVKRHSSSFVDGNPSSPKCAFPARRSEVTQPGLDPSARESRFSKCVSQRSATGDSSLVAVIMASGQGGLFLQNPIVAVLFELKSQALVARLDNFAIHKDMHKIRHDVIQQPLIMRDDQLGIVR